MEVFFYFKVDFIGVFWFLVKSLLKGVIVDVMVLVIVRVFFYNGVWVEGYFFVYIFMELYVYDFVSELMLSLLSVDYEEIFLRWFLCLCVWEMD